MGLHHWMVLCANLLFLWLLCGVEGDNKVVVKGSMGSKSFCESSKIRWLSEKTSVLIVGKSAKKSAKKCSIMFGAAVDPSKNVRLRLQFDFIYFDSCGVKLQINQSSTKDFENSKSNKEMFMSGCNRQNPGPLYSQPKHYVMISLFKVSNRLEGYNFRLNVSVAENLPVTGAPLRVVIIVSFVCFLVVAGAAFMLYKYANHLWMEWGDERRDENIDRAIQLFHTSSREASGDSESTMALVEPGVGVRSRQHGPEIAFVDKDGRVLRFQPLVEEEEGASGTSERGQHHHNPSTPTKATLNSSRREESPREEPTHFYLSFSQQDRQCPSIGHAASALVTSSSDIQTEQTDDLQVDNVDTTSIGGVYLPPSYEEALGMPLPLLGGSGGDDDGDSGGGNISSGSGSIGGACGGKSRRVSGKKTNDKGKTKGREPIDVLRSDIGDLVSDSNSHSDRRDIPVDSNLGSGSGRDYMNFLCGNGQDVDTNRMTTASEGNDGLEGDHPLIVYHQSSIPPPSSS